MTHVDYVRGHNQLEARDATDADGAAAAAAAVNPLSPDTVKLLEATGLLIDRDELMLLEEIGKGTYCESRTGACLCSRHSDQSTTLSHKLRRVLKIAQRVVMV